MVLRFNLLACPEVVRIKSKCLRLLTHPVISKGERQNAPVLSLVRLFVRSLLGSVIRSFRGELLPEKLGGGVRLTSHLRVYPPPSPGSFISIRSFICSLFGR